MCTNTCTYTHTHSWLGRYCSVVCCFFPSILYTFTYPFQFLYILSLLSLINPHMNNIIMFIRVYSLTQTHRNTHTYTHTFKQTYSHILALSTHNKQLVLKHTYIHIFKLFFFSVGHVSNLAVTVYSLIF